MKAEMNTYEDGCVIRFHNRRVAARKLADGETQIVIQAIVPDESADFAGNMIRGNYKQTSFALTPEAADSLFLALGTTLGYLRTSKSNQQPTP